jgi:uncharacterized LabA/DUF88 family protein
MKDCFVFVDNGFFKLAKREIERKSEKRLNFFKAFRNIAEKEECKVKRLFFYDAPPYQSKCPNEIENRLKKNYDRFARMIKSKKWINFNEGTCIKVRSPEGKSFFTQKGVDALMIMDMYECAMDSPEVQKMILIASDSDFVPIVEKMREKEKEIILYSYFDRIRGSKFSTSNQLLDSVSRWNQLKVEDFE